MRSLYTPARMAGQEFHIADGSVTFSRRELYISLQPGEVVTDHFQIRSSLEGPFCGEVFSDSVIMECLTSRFNAPQDRIGYRVDAAGLHDGDEVQGVIGFLTNRGEYRLPYHIYVSSPQMIPFGEEDAAANGALRDLSGIMNLQQFADLARMSWDQAVRVFYSASFPRLLKTQEEKILYKGLSVYPGNEQNVEEFLLAAGRKVPAAYSVQPKEIRMEILGRIDRANAQEQTVRLQIRRDGWGYTKPEIICAGRFLEEASRRTQRRVLTEADFEGDEAAVEIRILTRRLHAGKNFGAVILRCPYQEIEIPVEILCRRKNAREGRKSGSISRFVFELTQIYEQLCVGKLEGPAFLQRAELLIQRMELQDPGAELPRLYRAHLLLMQKKVRQAIAELENVRRKLAGVAAGEVLAMGYVQYPDESDMLYCYRQYLTALARDDAAEITPRAVRAIRERHRRHTGDWRIALMLMELSGEYPAGSEARWSFLRRQYLAGSRSPILYLEAWDLLAQAPGIIGRAEEAGRRRAQGDPFTLQVLRYAAKRGLMTADAMQRVIELAQKSRGFSGDLAGLLELGWQADLPEDMKEEILRTFCMMLIRGDMADSRYHVWYARAVAQGYRMTRLSDMYLRSLPEDADGPIPEQVLADLPEVGAIGYRAKAHAFRYLYEQRESHAQLWEQECGTIASFLSQQLREGHMNADLAKLYAACREDARLREQTAEQWPQNLRDRLTEASYTVEIRTTRTSMSGLILLYENYDTSEVRVLDNGVCRLPVFGDHNRFFFEDTSHNRYAVSVPYACDRMMQPAGAEAMPAESLPLFLLQISGAETDSFRVRKDNEAACVQLLDADDAEGSPLSEEIRGRIRRELLAYYEQSGQQTDPEKGRDLLLIHTDPVDLTVAERAAGIRTLSASDPAAAMDWLLDFGDSQTDPRAVLAAAEAVSAEGIPEEIGVRMIWRAVQKCPDAGGGVLEMLAQSLTGFSEELEELRGRCIEAGVPHAKLTGAILRQQLFTGEILPSQDGILEEAYTERADGEKVLEAALTAYCHHAFTEELRLGSFTGQLLRDRMGSGTPTGTICRLALLRDLSEEASLSGPDRTLARDLLGSLLQEDILFPFFRRFAGMNSRLDLYAGETLAEYCDRSGRQDAHIRIHYALEQDGKRDVFASRDMKCVYDRFYVSSFLLFYGEQIHYFVTDDEAGRNIVASGTLERDAQIRSDRKGRFGRIDAISRDCARGLREEALAGMEEYDRLDAVVRRVFHEGA